MRVTFLPSWQKPSLFLIAGSLPALGPRRSMLLVLSRHMSGCRDIIHGKLLPQLIRMHLAVFDLLGKRHSRVQTLPNGSSDPKRISPGVLTSVRGLVLHESSI